MRKFFRLKASFFLNDQKETKESLGANLVRLALLASQKFVPGPPLFTGASVEVLVSISGVR